MDGGVSFKKFWDGGDEILKALEEQSLKLRELVKGTWANDAQPANNPDRNETRYLKVWQYVCQQVVSPFTSQTISCLYWPIIIHDNEQK